jgi:hypothetical protein
VLTAAVVDHGVGFSEELFAVAEAEQEHEPVQVRLQLLDAVGVVADEGGEAVGEGLPLAGARLRPD